MNVRLWTACFALLFLSAPAKAAMLLIEYSGTFSPTSQLNGTNLGAHGHPVGTAFTLHSIFDSTADLLAPGGFGLYAASTTIDLNSYGTFSVDPGGPHVSFTSIAGTFVRVGAASSFGSNYWDINLPVSPSVLMPDSPSPGSWSPSSSGFVSSVTIPLAGTDTLFVQGLSSSFGTVTITVVPEPSSMLLLAIGLTCARPLFPRRKGMKNQAG